MSQVKSSTNIDQQPAEKLEAEKQPRDKRDQEVIRIGGFFVQMLFLCIIFSSYVLNIIVQSNIGFLKLHAYFTNQNMLISVILQFAFVLESLVPSFRKRSSCFQWILNELLTAAYTFSGFIVPVYWIFLSYIDFKQIPAQCTIPYFCYYYSFISHLVVAIPCWTRIIFGVTNITLFDFLSPLVYEMLYCVYMGYWNYKGFYPYAPLSLTMKVWYIPVIVVMFLSCISFLIGRRMARIDCRKKKNRDLEKAFEDIF